VSRVGDDGVSEEADLAEHRFAVVEAPSRVEGLVLDDQRDVVHPVLRRKAERGALGVVEDEHAGQPTVDVVGRLVVVAYETGLIGS
jgi:hypothetical protein